MSLLHRLTPSTQNDGPHHRLQLLGVLGSHDDFPVEALAFSHDRRLLASIAHDSAVRLWDMT